MQIIRWFSLAQFMRVFIGTRKERPSPVIFDAKRNFGIDSAPDEPVLLEMLQCVR